MRGCETVESKLSQPRCNAVESPVQKLEFEKMASRFQIKRESLENVIESLQCYNCKSTPGLGEGEKDRFSCFNESHQLCKDCKNQCKCGSEVGKNPNPIIQKVLEDLPMYCPHYKTGCRQVFSKSENLEDHRKGCVFRPVFCPLINCITLSLRSTYLL